jgi:hypothetical protein
VGALARTGFGILMAALAAAPLLSGCTAVVVETISEPYSAPEAPTRLGGDGIVRLERISVSAKPRNTVGIFAMMGWILPIFPIPFGFELYRDGQPFQVQVAFETDSPGFTLDPSQIVLVIRDQTFPATRVTPFIKADRPTLEDRQKPGHSFHCFDNRLSNDFQSVVNRPPIKLSTGCVDVEFPVKTPHPREPYAVHVKGLRHGEQEVDIEPIHFRRGTRTFFDVFSN